MRVLICGASGFIGRHLGRELLRHGHTVVALARQPRPDARIDFASELLRGDMARDLSPEDWLPRLAGLDAVVNAVGILRERGSQTFDRLHVQGPIALFDACARAGVPRVLQISALGADEGARSGYHLSKRQADTHLLALPLDATVVQPSLVYGPGGASATMFTAWASLPWVPLPQAGAQRVQPLHIDDLVQALRVLLEGREARGQRLALVGPQALSLRELLASLREGMGLGPAHWIEVPAPLVRGTVALGSRWPGALADHETLDMLERGNTAPADATTALLGHAPRPVRSFIDPERADTERTQARLAWLLPLLRLSLAAVWIVTGVLSFGVYPVADSHALLARVGLTGLMASIALYGAATLDLALGVATLAGRGRPWVWWSQIVLMLGYMVLITWALPEFWLHPFGPILKNLPMLAAVALLLALEKPKWNT
ncbi:MAG TPA: NAD(P)H-binding protein [Rhizobacter sp.]